jgi:hypothetical protein
LSNNFAKLNIIAPARCFIYIIKKLRSMNDKKLDTTYETLHLFLSVSVINAKQTNPVMALTTKMYVTLIE